MNARQVPPMIPSPFVLDLGDTIDEAADYAAEHGLDAATAWFTLGAVLRHYGATGGDLAHVLNALHVAAGERAAERFAAVEVAG